MFLVSISQVDKQKTRERVNAHGSQPKAEAFSGNWTLQKHCKTWPRKVKLNCRCCQSEEIKRRGFYRNKNFTVQRYECLRCGTAFSEKQPLDGL
ncbi:MAG TPA: hypothetical protein VK840_04520, partial [Candidatus Dormibacteraeota bacterium]|nr:hypothetical protein [Candidatus Dormibacteraeota bacterium]